MAEDVLGRAFAAPIRIQNASPCGPTTFLSMAINKSGRRRAPRTLHQLNALMDNGVRRHALQPGKLDTPPFARKWYLYVQLFKRPLLKGASME